MKNQIKLNQAAAGYLLNLEARHLSRNTINDYTITIRKFCEYAGNPDITDITVDTITGFLLSRKKELSNKTLSNYHSTLSALWTWLERQELVDKNIVQRIERPRPEKRQIVPLEADEIKAMFKVLNQCKPYRRPGKSESVHSLPNAERNRALIMLLLDSGLRVSELSEIRIRDLDEKNLRIFVMGKGSKERYVPYSARTGQVIWKYLTQREEVHPDDYLFETMRGRQMNRRLIHQTLEDIGIRAGVENVHPHRMRHTFAVSYLRAGGDIFTLQMILGHEHLEMVRHYSKLASQDMKRVHRRASPVEFFRL